MFAETLSEDSLNNILLALILLLIYLLIRIRHKNKHSQGSSSHSSNLPLQKRVSFNSSFSSDNTIHSDAKFPDPFSVITFVSQSKFKYFILIFVLTFNAYSFNISIRTRFAFVFICVCFLQYIVIQSYNLHIRTQKAKDPAHNAHLLPTRIFDTFHQISYSRLIGFFIVFGIIGFIRKQNLHWPVFNDPGYYASLILLIGFIFHWFPRKMNDLEIRNEKIGKTKKLIIYVGLFLLLVVIFSQILFFVFEQWKIPATLIE